MGGDKGVLDPEEPLGAKSLQIWKGPSVRSALLITANETIMTHKEQAEAILDKRAMAKVLVSVYV